MQPVAPTRGQGGGPLPPNVEKDGPRNSSKFDEKIGRENSSHFQQDRLFILERGPKTDLEEHWLKQ